MGFKLSSLNREHTAYKYYENWVLRSGCISNKWTNGGLEWVRIVKKDGARRQKERSVTGGSWSCDDQFPTMDWKREKQRKASRARTHVHVHGGRWQKQYQPRDIMFVPFLKESAGAHWHPAQLLQTLYTCHIFRIKNIILFLFLI